MKIAIVHDWLYGGGAEKVVLELHKMFPDAPIYTSYCSDEWRNRLDNKVITGYLQRAPFRQLRKFLPLLRQHWFSHLDLSDFDIVISSTGNGEAKFVRTPNGTHICYCHTPNHFYWRHYDEYLKRPGFKPTWLARFGLRLLVKPLRRRDYAAAQRVDSFVANSTHIQKDIHEYYGRESEVVFPPVEIDRFTKFNSPVKRRGFVTMGRQVPLKHTDLLIQACNELGVPLTVIGTGPEHDSLVQIAGPTITFKTGITDEQMPSELASAEAFLFASYEDFGIAPIEAMATGTPVIAYKAGGALDYIQPGETGEFFEQQTTESLMGVIRKFKASDYKTKTIQASAQRFSIDQFHKNIDKIIKKYDNRA